MMLVGEDDAGGRPCCWWIEMMLLVQEHHDREKKNTTFDDVPKYCPINVGSFWSSFAIVWVSFSDRSEVKKTHPNIKKTHFFIQGVSKFSRIFPYITVVLPRVQTGKQGYRQVNKGTDR